MPKPLIAIYLLPIIDFFLVQLYAPTIMACARDFWTLRYTSVLDDGCCVV